MSTPACIALLAIGLLVGLGAGATLGAWWTYRRAHRGHAKYWRGEW